LTSSLAFTSPSIFTNANEMGAIVVVSSVAWKGKFLCVFSFLDYSMVMELLEEEKRAKNLLVFSCAGSSWIQNKTIHIWTCWGFFFSFQTPIWFFWEI
jgi:hypothetical protein